MIECSSCHTLNPDTERACLVCGSALAQAAQTRGSTLAAARCPAGHPIDPSWKSCPYCDRLQATAPLQKHGSPGPGQVPGPAPTRLESDPPSRQAGRRTRLEGEPDPVADSSPPASASGPKPTRLEEEPAGRRTVLQESLPSEAPPVAGSAPQPQADRHGAPATPGGASLSRLVAVLAAPDLGAAGAVFPIRAGRNTIGADRTSDVSLAADSEVSREHAVILHRNGCFYLADRLSTNGTWVNGREVPANGTVPLHDRDLIRCGRTDLLFLALDAVPLSDVNPVSET